MIRKNMLSRDSFSVCFGIYH